MTVRFLNFTISRIGTEVVSQKHFDTWWKSAAKDPELLNFERYIFD